MYTVIVSPTHILPVETKAPTQRDALGQGAYEMKRQWTRPLKRWELVVPGTRQKLDPIAGLLDLAQGDTIIKFDGAGTLEVVEPILIGVGNGTITDFALPHRNVFVASTVVFLNGGATNTWAPLGDGVVMDKIRISPAPGNFAQIKAKYRRSANVFLETESENTSDRVFRNQSDSGQSLYRMRFFLQESPL